MYGSDASNTFAGAPPPVCHVYVSTDTHYRYWWKAQGKPDIQKGYGLPVKHALQGHPQLSMGNQNTWYFYITRRQTYYT